jgi:transposase
MRSKWSELKPKACKVRRQGISIRSIEKKLGIPRSTLSGWFRDINLSKKQQDNLRKID